MSERGDRSLDAWRDGRVGPLDQSGEHERGGARRNPTEACVDCARGIDPRDLRVECEFCRGAMCHACQIRPYRQGWRSFWACHGCVAQALNARLDGRRDRVRGEA